MVKGLTERDFAGTGTGRKLAALAIAAMVIITTFIIPTQAAFAEVFEEVDLKIDKVVYEGEGYGPSGKDGVYMPGDKVAFDVTATVEGDEEDIAFEATIHEEWPEGISYTGCQVLNTVPIEGEWETHTPEVDASDFPTIRICQQGYDICSMYVGQIVTIRLEGIVEDIASEDGATDFIEAVNRVTFTADYQDPVSDEAEIIIGREDPEEPEEPTEPVTPTDPTEPVKPAEVTETPSLDPGTPKTGDDFSGGILAVLLAGLSAAGGTGTVLFRKAMRGE